MTFNPNIPSTGNRINQQYLIVQNNFATSNALYGLDHYAWNDATPSLRGLHRKLTLIQQAADPAASASGGIAYTKKNPDANVTRTDPYYRFESGALGNGMIAPMVPFKAFAIFDVTTGSPVPPANIFQSYNVASITHNGGAPTRVFTVNFTNKLDNSVAGSPMNYIVLVTVKSSATNNSFAGFRNTTNSSFDIIMSTVPAVPQVSFGVIQF